MVAVNKEDYTFSQLDPQHEGLASMSRREANMQSLSLLPNFSQPIL